MERDASMWWEFFSDFAARREYYLAGPDKYSDLIS
jgi:hypothetical protein